MKLRRPLKHAVWRGYSKLLSAVFRSDNTNYLTELDDFKSNSYIVKRDVLDVEFLNRLRLAIDEKLSSREYITEIGADNYGGSIENFKKQTNFLTLKDPFINIPELLKILENQYVTEMLLGILGARAALTGINVRKSIKNDRAPETTNFFHVDGNGGRVIKLFIYFNDVVTVADGPTQLFATSAERKPWGWANDYRVSYAELADFYGAENLVSLFNRVGGVQIVDTTSFHRGLKVESRSRLMATFSFTNHIEYFSKRMAQRIFLPMDAPSPLFRYCKRAQD